MLVGGCFPLPLPLGGIVKGKATTFSLRQIPANPLPWGEEEEEKETGASQTPPFLSHFIVPIASFPMRSCDCVQH